MTRYQGWRGNIYRRVADMVPKPPTRRPTGSKIQYDSRAAYMRRRDSGMILNIERIPALEAALGVLPRDSEQYDSTGSWTFAHAAAPNTLRIKSLISLHALMDIGDEETRVYDKYIVNCTFKGAGTTGIPQSLYFFTVKGPTAITFTDSDKDPTSGIRAAIEGCTAGGTETKHFRTLNVKPVIENGAWVLSTSFKIDVTDLLNKFTSESEKAIGQGRTQPEMYLVCAIDGVASTSDVIAYQNIRANHQRKRLLAV